MAFVRLWHVLAGIYLLVSPPSFAYDAVGSKHFLSRWEFVTSLDYEWKVYRGQLPRRWTIWVSVDRLLTLASSATLETGADLLIQQVYSFARVMGLLGIILNFVGLDVTSPINCQVSTVFYVRPILGF